MSYLASLAAGSALASEASLLLRLIGFHLHNAGYYSRSLDHSKHAAWYLY
jgi:hypothetical protein